MQGPFRRLAQHLADREPVDQHQDDDRRNRHPQHSHAEDGLSHSLAGEFFERQCQVTRVVVDQHRRQSTIDDRQSGNPVTSDLWRQVRQLHSGLLIVQQLLQVPFELVLDFHRNARHIAFTQQPRIRLAVKLGRRGNHDATGRQHERKEETDRKIKDRQAAEVAIPLSFQQRVRKQEGHVDPHRGRSSRHHAASLTVQNHRTPIRLVATRFGQSRRVRIGNTPQQADVRHEPGHDLAPWQGTLESHRHHDAKETQYDHPNHHLQHHLEQLQTTPTTVIRPDNRHGGPKQDRRADQFAVLAGEQAQVLPHGGCPECELRHRPDQVGHQCGNRPTPTQHRADMLVDRLERTLLGRQGDIADRTEHHDAQDQHQRLQPQQVVTGDHAQVKTAAQRAATQGDCTLQPARA